MKRCYILHAQSWLVAFLICSSMSASAQDPSASIVVSPSPASSGLARYSEVPVDLSTGVPNIAIPLHVIESPKLTFPISMSYHASGIKVGDVAGPLGTGWTLNAGGMINRIMRSRPDEQANGFFSFASAIPDENDPLTLAVKDDLHNHVTDMMPDVFYYNTGASIGKIIFDNQLQPRTIPDNTLKISVPSTTTLATFAITDPSGTNYEFEAGETATVSYWGWEVTPASATYISNWYLARIVSADKTDTIKFNYSLQNSYSYTTSLNSSLNFYYDAPAGSWKHSNPVGTQTTNADVTVTGTRYLSNIEHNGGKVAFTFSGGRSDDPDGKKLDEIIICDKDPVAGTYVENRRILFSYGYFDNTDSGTRLRLDAFREKLGPTAFNPPYRFTYSAKRLPAPSSAAQDHWGYYNGAITNTNLIPAHTHAGIPLSTNDREVNPNYVDACIIKSITSPLAGTTEFVFESNKYLNGTDDEYGPGLRISKIIKRDPFSSIIAVTNYEYNNPADGKSSGRLMNSPEYFTDLDVIDHAHAGNFLYSCLLIKVNGTSVGNFPGPPLIYQYVTTYSNDDATFSGKTISKFSVYTPQVMTFPYFPVNDNSWDAGDMLTQETYAYQNGAFTIVRKVENTYEESPYSFTIKGLSCARNKIFFFANPSVNDFIVRNYLTHSKFKYLKESKVYDFEQSSGTIYSLITQTYYYDNANVHLFPTRVESTTSLSGETVKREIKYVADGPSTGVNGVMKSLNMTGLPVESLTSRVKNGTEYITGYEKTDYFEWNTDKVYAKNFYGSRLPDDLLRSAFEADPESYMRLNQTINAYDNQGVVLESEMTGDAPTSVIVDSRWNRVVATANAAASDQIAYSSFESTDFGNWEISTGTTTTTHNVELSLNYTFEPIVLQAGQTINYTYSLTQSNGPGAHLIFTKEGTTPIDHYITGSSGSGAVTLSAGSWTVSVTYEFNVTALDVDFSYQRTTDNAPSITAAQAKTGQRSLQLGASQTVYRNSLPSGTYTVIYYQKGGTPTLTPTGSASVLSTNTSTAEADGWSKVKKEINISGPSQGIQITGTTAMYIDELRLYPSGSFMTTRCYDVQKRLITKTDVNLRSEFTEYDAWQRVKAIRDHEKHIVQHYDYQMAID